MFSARCSAVVLTFGLWTASGFGAVDEELCQQARDGTRQAREAISTIHARLTIARLGNTAKVGGRSLQSSGEWWQDGTSYRWNENRSRDVTLPDKREVNVERSDLGVSVDGVVTRTDLKNANSLNRLTQPVFSIRPDQGTAQFVDVWVRSGLNILGRPRLWLHDALAQREWVREVRRVDRQDVSCLHVTLYRPEDGWGFQVWIDPVRGYMPVRTLSYLQHSANFSERKSYTENIVHSFHDLGNGIYFPKTTTFNWHADGEPVDRMTSTSQIQIDVVAVNQRLDPDLFRLKIPVGAVVMDHVADRSYTVGKDGKPREVMSPMPRPTDFPNVVQALQKFEQPTPRTSYRLALVVGIVVVLGLLVFVTYKSRKRLVAT